MKIVLNLGRELSSPNNIHRAALERRHAETLGTNI